MTEGNVHVPPSLVSRGQILFVMGLLKLGGVNGKGSDKWK